MESGREVRAGDLNVRATDISMLFEVLGMYTIVQQVNVSKAGLRMESWVTLMFKGPSRREAGGLETGTLRDQKNRRM